MSLIEQATRRLEELSRAGVAVPWEAAGRTHGALDGMRAEPDRLLDPVGAASPTPSLDTDTSKHLANVGPEQAAQRVDRSRPDTPVTLDLARIEAAGLLTPDQARTALAEEFRQIKRPLLKNARSSASAENRSSLIMVTSALPGEGKTTCAINLAMSMATEVDISVILVDADVVRPDLPSRLGVAAEKGLMDIVADSSLDLPDVLLTTNVPKLSILPAGSRTHLATELLASESMGALLTSLTTRYPDHVVIFDAPPLLLTSEAKVLASRVGQVVMVVDASNTPASAISQAFAQVEHCPVVMSVLNKAASERGAFGYGYYYG